ncbi:MAG: HlyC/CorC family transporter [Lachnospiraceae bacterium]|nr:HlyC/CorC family transporter [Butyrivibrio sp.]MBQ9910512.1 HlyC/CorC family transporter [Lachnospiraceae bacterium]
MDGDSRPYWIITGILVLLAAVFALIETALSSVSKNRIKVLSERGDTRAENALFAIENFDQAITTLLICTNIVHIAAAALVTHVVTRTWGLSAVSLSTVITTIVVFFVGEMLPKSIAKKNSEKYILQNAGFLRVLMKVFTPFSYVLSKIGEVAGKYAKAEPEVSVTEDELYDIIEGMEEEGTIDESQSDLIASALSFSDVTVEAILTPRVDLVALDIDEEPEETLNIIKNTNHSRIPVYENTVDNIIGVLQTRKFMKQYLQEKSIPALRPLLDEVYFTTAAANIDELLSEMSKNKLNMAVIVDNYGGTMGIVTVEDILEEIVGEIWDEDDVIEEPIVKLAEGTYEADAGETVEALFDFMEYEDPEENEDFVNMPISEWVLSNFQAVPEEQDAFVYHHLHVTVSKMEHNRILKVRVDVSDKDESMQEETPESENGGIIADDRQESAGSDLDQPVKAPAAEAESSAKGGEA